MGTEGARFFSIHLSRSCCVPNDHDEFSHTEYVASAISVPSLLFLRLVVAIREEIKQKEPLPPISSVQEPNSSSKSERGEDYSILQTIFNVDMTVLFMAMICGAGGALAAINNMGQRLASRWLTLRREPANSSLS